MTVKYEKCDSKGNKINNTVAVYTYRVYVNVPNIYRDTCCTDCLRSRMPLHLFLPMINSLSEKHAQSTLS